MNNDRHPLVGRADHLRRQDTLTITVPQGPPTITTETTPTTTPTTTTRPTTATTPTTVAPPVTTTSTTSRTTSTSAPPTTTPPTTTPPSTTNSLSTRSDGAIVTLTLTQSPTPTFADPAPPKGFFQNKPAMGAVFGVAGLAVLVLLFALITTCIRRRRAQKFDRDVAEAAAAAARDAEDANPYMVDDDRWKGPISNHGYSTLDDDPYGYAATGVVGGAAAAGAYGMQNQYKRQSMGEAYNMNDMGNAPYGGGAAYYMDDPRDFAGVGHARAPSAGSAATAPGFAGVGSGGATGNAAAYYANASGYDNNHLRQRAVPMLPGPSSAEDAYGGYAQDMDRYPNPYAAYSNVPPPVPPKAMTQMSQSSGSQNIQSSYNPTPSGEGSASPLIGGGNQMRPMSGDSQADGKWDDNQPRILKVANE